MFQLNAVSLGILFIALGLVIWVLIRLLMRGVPGRRSTNTPPDKAEVSEKLNANQNAVLEVQAGGWVVSINERGRQLFEMQKGEEPNLERLARRVRPAETFLSLCVSEGESSFRFKRPPGGRHFLFSPGPVNAINAGDDPPARTRRKSWRRSGGAFFAYAANHHRIDPVNGR